MNHFSEPCGPVSWAPMPRSRILSRVALLGGLGSACHQGEPPSPVNVDAAVSPLPPPRTAAAAPTTAASSVAPPAGPDPGTLPQTSDKPEATGAVFNARVTALWEAIAKDDPDRAMPFFFPVTAYEQVKAITNASSDWRRRLVAAYKRDVHGLHKRLGDHAADAKFVRADVPQERARWVEPNEESNKLGYYRVYGTRLVYEVDGKEKSLEVTSLISWRGEWYVVHLSGFK